MKLTVAQALITYLSQQYSVADGQRRRLIPATLGIFGHGNVAGLGQALDQLSDAMPFVQGRNEQALVHIASGYAKASRRGADRDDGVVLCGRLRDGWTLHIALDTSGSMEQVLPKVLGTIASFCDGAGVAEIHILQCDIEVTRDEWLEPAQLSEYKIAGFGGSNMSPALDQLARDTEVSAVLVLTDGYISYPATEPPYTVLWGVVRAPTGYDANLTWNAAPGAAAYRIFWRDAWGPDWQHELLVGNVTNVVLTNMQIDDYVFGVAAIDADGHESLVSPYVTPPRQGGPVKTVQK